MFWGAPGGIAPAAGIRFAPAAPVSPVKVVIGINAAHMPSAVPQYPFAEDIDSPRWIAALRNGEPALRERVLAVLWRNAGQRSLV